MLFSCASAQGENLICFVDLEYCLTLSWVRDLYSHRCDGQACAVPRITYPRTNTHSVFEWMISRPFDSSTTTRCMWKVRYASARTTRSYAPTNDSATLQAHDKSSVLFRIPPFLRQVLIGHIVLHQNPKMNVVRHNKQLYLPLLLMRVSMQNAYAKQNRK